MYKLYASVLRSKLQLYVEPNMRKLQYGFRPARSTSQPILILRRLFEIYERGGEPLHLVFLDWKKALIQSNTPLSMLLFTGSRFPSR
jgi:hypothetical protein